MRLFSVVVLLVQLVPRTALGTAVSGTLETQTNVTAINNETREKDEKERKDNISSPGIITRVLKSKSHNHHLKSHSVKSAMGTKTSSKGKGGSESSSTSSSGKSGKGGSSTNGESMGSSDSSSVESVGSEEEIEFSDSMKSSSGENNTSGSAVNDAGSRSKSGSANLSHSTSLKSSNGGGSKGNMSEGPLPGSKSVKSKSSKGPKSSSGDDTFVCSPSDILELYELSPTKFYYSVTVAATENIEHLMVPIGGRLYSEAISAMCDSSRFMLNVRRVEVDGGLNVHSLSNTPADVLADDQSHCGTADCYVIEGSLTMTSGSEDDEDSLVSQLLTVLKSAIDSGAFDDLAPIEYIGPDPSSVNAVRANDVDEDNSESDEMNTSSWREIVVIIGTVGVVCVALFIIRRKRQRNSDSWSEVESVSSAQSLEMSSIDQVAVVVDDGWFEKNNPYNDQNQEALPAIMEEGGDKEYVKDNES